MKNKDHILSIRLTREEKIFLEKEAAAFGMPVSQFFRYKALTNKETQNNSVDHILDDSIKTLSRALMQMYFYIEKFAQKTLTQEELQLARKEANVQIEKLGLKKDGGNN